MARSSAMALNALLLSCLLAGALAGPAPPPVYPPPPAVYPPPGAAGTYPPPGVYPSPSPPTPPPAPPPSPGAATNLTGYARFFGPLSAGCNVVYVNNGSTTQAANTLLGQVSVGAYQTIRVTPGAGCTDLFTGIAIPYNLGGKSPANAPFQVSSTNTIAAASGDLAQTAAFSYSKLNVKGAPQFETSEIFSVIRTGNSSAWQLLNADLRYILASVVMSNAYIAASVPATAGNTCNTVALAQNAFASYATGMRSLVPIYPSSAASGMLFNCGVSNITQALIDSIATSSVNNTLQVLSAGIPYLSRPPALDLAAMSRWASMLSASSLIALNTMTTGTMTAVQTQIDAALNAAAINPDQIATYLGLAGATVAQATTVQIVGTGPLSGAVATFTPYHTKVNSTLAATVSNDIQTAASTTNPAGYFGFYSVAAGAIDLFLTANFSNPVVSLMPFTGVMGFTTPASSSVTLAPIAAVVNSAWWINQMSFVNSTTNDMNPPSAPGPADWLAAYNTIVGGVLDPSYDYMSRTYPNGSPSQVLVMVADALVSGTSGLIGQWINGSIAGKTTTTAAQISTLVFNKLVGLPAAQYSNNTRVVSIIRDVYFASGGVVPPPNYGGYGGYYPPPAAAGTYPPPPASYPPPPAAASGRRSLLSSRHLLQSAVQNPDFDNTIISLASSICDSNSLITAYISVIASGSFTRRLLQTSNAAVGTAQVSAVQNQDMANAAAAISAAVAAGDTFNANRLATAFAQNFGGAALRNLVNSKAVNSAAINSATSSGGSSNNKKKIALGVGLGVGLGVPIVAAAIAGIVIFIKNRRAEQTTAPAATAEGVHNVREFAVAPAGNNSVVPTPQEEQIAAYYRNRLAVAGYSS